MMMDNNFEKAFGEYLDSAEYDTIANELFAATRKAFLAGWIAAGAKTTSSLAIPISSAISCTVGSFI